MSDGGERKRGEWDSKRVSNEERRKREGERERG
jgi:hypothetical protein